jgi:CheY-like chemotaxis protein
MTAAALSHEEKLPNEVREQLAMIERNVALEARLIDDLLDLTRVTHGKLALRAEPCDAHSLIALAVEIVRDEAREKQIDIAMGLTAERSRLMGDPARLQQVFWNLLRNAVKFTPRGGHIRIRSHDGLCHSEGKDEPSVCIEVSDDGSGFEPSEAERLFEPFHQGVSSSSPGLGLGLAIARAVVDLHGGKIQARSSGRDQGATFTVELPATTAGMHAAVAGEDKRHVAQHEETTEPSLRLLVVEDDAPTLQVLARLLTRAGHQVTTASSIAAARTAAANGKFDVVVSDLGLPDGTGIELMEHLRSAHGLSGIALSGYGMEEDLRRSEEAGFVAHLVKPVDVGELRRMLRRFAKE